MKGISLLYVFVIVIAGGLFSCSKAQVDKERIEAQNMYPRLLNLLQKSIDSLSIAKDSLSVLSHSERLSSDLTLTLIQISEPTRPY